jgi:hypothetical protein
MGKMEKLINRFFNICRKWFQSHANLHSKNLRVDSKRSTVGFVWGSACRFHTHIKIQFEFEDLKNKTARNYSWKKDKKNYLSKFCILTEVIDLFGTKQTLHHILVLLLMSI